MDKEPEHYRAFILLRDGGDHTILKCTCCDEIFYSSPCGEDNVEWDEKRKCLVTTCPNGCSKKKNTVA